MPLPPPPRWKSIDRCTTDDVVAIHTIGRANRDKANIRGCSLIRMRLFASRHTIEGPGRRASCTINIGVSFYAPEVSARIALTQSKKHAHQGRKRYAAFLNSRVADKGPITGGKRKGRKNVDNHALSVTLNEQCSRVACLAFGPEANKKVILHDARNQASTAVAFPYVAWPCGSFQNPLPAPVPLATGDKWAH